MYNYFIVKIEKKRERERIISLLPDTLCKIFHIAIHRYTINNTKKKNYFYRNALRILYFIYIYLCV